VELFTDDVNLLKGLDRAGKKLKAWGASMTAAGMKAVHAGIELAKPLWESAKAYAEMGAEMARASQITGVGVEALSQLKHAAEDSGVGFDQLQTGLKKMAKGIYDAARGSPQATQALRTLGLSVRDLQTLSPDKQFELIAEKLSQIPNPTEKAALAMKLFGKAGADLLPLLNQGAAGIANLMHHADELDLTMSSQDAAAALEFDQRLTDLWDVVKMGVFQIGGALAPVLRSVTLAFTSGVQAVRNFIREHQGLIVLAGGITAAILAVGTALIVFGQAMAFAGAALSGVAGAWGILTTVFAATLSPLGLIIIAIGAAGYALMKFTSIGSAVGTYLSAVFNGLKDETLGAFGGIRDALAAGDWGLAAQILWAYIKLEFAKGVNQIREWWLELKAALFDTWADLSAGIQTLWSYVVEYLSNWDGVKTAAQKLLTWLGGAFQNTVNRVANLLQDLFMTTGKKQLKIEIAKIDADEAAGKYGGNKALAEQQRNAARRTYGDYDDKQRSDRDAKQQADYAAKQKALDDQYGATHPEEVARAEAARARIDAERKAQIAKDQAELNKQLANGGSQAKIDELRRQLAAMQAQAKADAASNAPKLKTTKFDPNAAQDGIDGAMKSTAAGTFNAAGVFGFGESPLNRLQRIAADQLIELRKIAAQDVGGTPAGYES
jgi:hypothetical protein